MINIESNYQYVNDLVSKNNGVYISPREYEKYAQIASDELFDSLIGAKNQNVAVYGRNRTLDYRLKPFRLKAPLVFSSGATTLPANCRKINAIYTADTKIPVKPLDEDRAREILRDPLAKPNADDIYYLEGATSTSGVSTIELIATVPSLSCTIEYLRQPAKPVYGFTNPTGRRAVFNPLTSVNFDWDANMEEELTNRILAKVGLSMNNGTVIQFANNNKATE